MFSRIGNVDKQIVGIILALTLIGIIMVYSSSAMVTQSKYGDPNFYLKKGLVRVFLGVGLMVVISNIDYKILMKWAPKILIISMIPLIMTLIPTLAGKGAVNGANRWVKIPGLSTFQPSEMVKVALIIFMASYLAKRQMILKNFKEGFLPAIAIPGAVVAVIILQPNFGMAITISIVVALMIWVAGAKTSHMLLTAGTTVPVLFGLLMAHSHSRARILGFISSSPDVRREGYQITQSLIAFGNGGFNGVGLGQSRQKLFYLPEAHTDFIFAVIGEELGMIGTIAVVGLFLWLLWRGMRVAVLTEDRFGSYLAFGFTSMMFVFAVLNICVVTKIIPTTGIPLPFISYGGTALLFNMIAVGIILNISRSVGVPEKSVVETEVNEGTGTKSIFICRRGHGGTHNSSLQDCETLAEEVQSKDCISGEQQGIRVYHSPKVGV